jgi:DNA-binding LytR/AlgR family response regulator
VIILHIAICDDNAIELSHISELLNRYRLERNAQLIYITYLNATELLSAMEKNLYDLLLLDILMPGFTGIEAAREIRTFDQIVKIIFLTSSPEFALDSYGVKAIDYILNNPKRYGEDKEQYCGSQCYERDRMEEILFNRVLELDKPAFIIIEKDSILYDVFGNNLINVNSYHHQGIKQLSKRLKCVARAEDGMIESVFMPNKRFIVSVQWHPEFIYDFDDENLQLFIEFVKACI